MTIERVRHTSAIKVTELVSAGGIGTWFETQTYFGYTAKEAKKLYLAYLKANGFKVVK